MKPYLELYNEGYVRLSLNLYTTENFEKDKITNLTNNSVQKNHPDYKAMKEKSIISIPALGQDLVLNYSFLCFIYQILVEEGIVASLDEYRLKVETKIQEIMRLVFLTVKEKLDRKFGCFLSYFNEYIIFCFEIFGFDFMIDSELKLYLIEINTNPAIFTDT